MGQQNTNITSARHRSFTRSQQPEYLLSRSSRLIWELQNWIPFALLITYLIFSIAFYTVLPDAARRVFWFLYLTIATLVAGTTTMEAYDGLTPLTEARKGLRKFIDSDFKYTTADAEFPSLHLIFYAQNEKIEGLWHFLDAVAEEGFYPAEKLSVTVLRRGMSQFTPTIDHIGVDHSSNAQILTIPRDVAPSLSAYVAYYLGLDAPQTEAAVTAIFSGHERPHPHSARQATERLLKESKLDVVQGRTVFVPPSGRSRLVSTLFSLQHDMTTALLQPGRSITWTVTVPCETNAYWRTDALRAVANSTAPTSEDGLDLGWTSVRRGTKSTWDLRVIAFAPCPSTFEEFWCTLARASQEAALATLRYSRLAFTNIHHSGQQDKMPPKARVGILYMLPVNQLTSHTALQFLCLALALLFTDMPHSLSDFRQILHWRYPISEWLMTLGLISLVATVGMTYTARSEFVPLWTAPLFLAFYPLFLAIRAVIDVYGQSGTLL